MNIYLDVDGVILTKHGEPAAGIADFLHHVHDNHVVYWLTTRCKGNSDTLVAHLKTKLPQDTHPLLESIGATNWDALKTDAIDFSHDFRWLDDFCMESEKKVLEEHNAVHKHILIDLKNNPNQLKELLSFNF